MITLRRCPRGRCRAASAGLIAAALTAALAVSCGASPASKHYSADPTWKCLRSIGVGKDGSRYEIDAVAEENANWAFFANGLPGGGRVVISFGNAAKIVRAYAREKREKYPFPKVKVESVGNVVLGWETYTPGAEDAVRKCLQ
jgi:hypothetical protein